MGSTGESVPLINRGTLPSGNRVSVVVCSCSRSNTVEGIIQLIRQNMADVVKSVKFRLLPYNVRDMDEFDFSGIDVLLLCHSIENRRFSLTNVTDALYDGFLPKARNYLGKSKVGVIAHDFPKEALSPDNLTSRMQSFKHTQETTFNNSSLVLIGGQLSRTPVGLTHEQLNHLKWFFHEASSPTMGESVIVCWYRFIHWLRIHCCCCGCYYV